MTPPDAPVLNADGKPARSREPWPAWAKHLTSFAAGVVVVVVWVLDVRADAKIGAALAPRVTAIELKGVAVDGRFNGVERSIEALTKSADEVRMDVKELLRRTPK